MSSISPKNNFILIGAILVYLLVTIVPFIDYFSSWYVSMIPVVIIIFYSIKNGTSATSGISFLVLGFLTVFLDWFLFTARNEFLFYTVRRIIAWAPCFIALLCVKDISVKSQKFIVQTALIAMGLTCITTIRGLEIYEHAARALAGVADQETRNTYALLNIGGYDFIYAMVLCIPVVFWMIDHTKKWMKAINILILLLFIVCIYKSAYTSALIISAVILLMIYMDKHPKYKPVIIFATVVFILFEGVGVFSSAFTWFSLNVEDEYVADRLQQVALLLQGKTVDQIDTDTSNARLLLMHQAWEGFLNSPIWGNNFWGYQKAYMSGHSYVLDILSASGVIGLSIYIYLYIRIFKCVFVNSFSSLIFYSRIIWLAFIILAIINPVFFPVIYLVLFAFTFIINNLSKYEESYDKQ